MFGDVRDPLAVDVDLAPVAQRVEEFRAGERPLLAARTASGTCVMTMFPRSVRLDR
jgi:hypothetical protein